MLLIFIYYCPQPIIEVFVLLDLFGLFFLIASLKPILKAIALIFHTQIKITRGDTCESYHSRNLDVVGIYCVLMSHVHAIEKGNHIFNKQ